MKLSWLVAGLVVVLVAGIGINSWVASQRHEAAMQTLKKVHAQELAEIERKNAEREKELNDKIAGWEKQAKAAKTPAQQVKVINEHVPLPIPIEAPPDLSNLPVTIPKEDLPALTVYVTECSICKAKLAEAQVDIADREQVIKNLQEERDEAIKALHGGSFWEKVKTRGKWAAIGAGGAVIAIEVLKKH